MFVSVAAKPDHETYVDPLDLSDELDHAAGRTPYETQSKK